jgi:hypothetical protein
LAPADDSFALAELDDLSPGDCLAAAAMATADSSAAPAPVLADFAAPE